MLQLSDVSIHYNLGTEKIGTLKEFVIKKIKRKLTYTEFWALKNITVKVEPGEVLGVIGHNGAGKSTLLKIMAGVLNPTKGSIIRNGRISPLIELGAGFDPQMTARDNIYLNGAVLGYSRQFLEKQFSNIIEYAELEKFVDVPIKNYSSGMVGRLAFSIATSVEPEILLVDEILSVGDISFQKKSEQRMRALLQGGATTVFVSHSLGKIKELCTKVLWLDHGEMRAYGKVAEICDDFERAMTKK